MKLRYLNIIFTLKKLELSTRLGGVRSDNACLTRFTNCVKLNNNRCSIFIKIKFKNFSMSIYLLVVDAESISTSTTSVYLFLNQ